MEQIVVKLNEARDILSQLSPRPIPPEITSVAERDTLWLQQCLIKLEPSIIRLPLDGKYRLTTQSNFLNIVAWDWVDSKKYLAEVFDCENFAITFKAHVDWYFGLNQVGVVIDYAAGHGYNLVVFPDGKVMLLEPQSDQLIAWPNMASLYVLKNAFVLI
ncbi:hypothetical protein MUP77_18805 [Candidatus Bathyarchaeota archaeon]|nr:hypothetical protein [Candidatus Bathyarchaeota archaeon]